MSYFHPFASGAEGQALAQGLELARRGHIVHVVTKDVPGYPIVDEEYHGVFIHRWIKTAAAGPLFGLSFVAGVIGALRRLRGEIDVIHTHQGLWEAVATGLARTWLSGQCQRWFSRPARATTARPTSCGAPAAPGCSAGRSWPTRPSRRSRPISSGSGASSVSPRGG